MPQPIPNIVKLFDGFELDELNKTYLKYHSKRYLMLMNTVKDAVDLVKKEGSVKSIRILDIGANFQTELLRKQFSDDTIDTLGFENTLFNPGEGEVHLNCDLNDIPYQPSVKILEKYDVIVFAEVLEHLYTSPKLVLEQLRLLLKKGGIIVVQTPNGVSLYKRIKMVLGIMPVEIIRESKTNPGHFREYTLKELLDIGNISGYSLVKFEVGNYFSDGSLARNIYNNICRFLPNSFRDGITILFRND